MVDAPLAAIPALQVEEAGDAGAAVTFGHVGEALALTRALRATVLLVPGAERRAGAGWGQIRDHTVSSRRSQFKHQGKDFGFGLLLRLHLSAGSGASALP